MMTVTMTEIETIEYRHMMDPLDCDGGPFQCLAPGRPLTALSGAPGTGTDAGHPEPAATPIQGHTAV